MAAEPTAGGMPAINIGTNSNADLVLLANVKRRRARRLAMRDGHPLLAPHVGESRHPIEDEQRRRG
jgi:hypothetical protein